MTDYVLVHGAWGGHQTWSEVPQRLEAAGHRVLVATLPGLGVRQAELHPGITLTDHIDAVAAQIAQAGFDRFVLAGHSYGGMVITDAAYGNNNVKALVYVAGFVPDAGDSAFALSTRFPGSTLGEALRPVPLPVGGVDLYIQSARFHDQFADDLPADVAALMAATQRPVTQGALEAKTVVATWKAVPAYVIYGTDDHNIPAELERFMAERAGAVKTVEIKGGSHALMISHPADVAALIQEAAIGALAE